MSDQKRPIGPLTGITIIEVPNIGPLQYAGLPISVPMLFELNASIMPKLARMLADLFRPI